MRASLSQVIFGIALSAILGGAFATAANLISGSQMFGISILSGLIIGAIFAAVGALFIGLATAVTKLDSKFFFITSGIAYGAIVYLANVYFGFNAGFSLFGLTLVSAFGLMSGIACLAISSIYAGFDRLHQLS